MKYVLTILGLVAAFATYHQLPLAFSELVKVTGFAAGVSGLATLLTASWIVSLAKLSVLEKLDDLPSEGRSVVTRFVSAFRKRIIGTIIANLVTATAAIASVFIVQVTSFSNLHTVDWVGYLLFGSLGFWLGGAIDSWRCWHAIDRTREEIVVASIELRRRSEMLKSLRSDAKTMPVARDDSHLNGYTA